MLTSQQLADQVSELRPGEHCTVPRYLLDDTMRARCSIFQDNDWTGADWVLEKIVGSAYEFGYYWELTSGDTIFYRLRQPLTDGRRTYVSPDRRHYYKPWTFGPFAQLFEPYERTFNPCHGSPLPRAAHGRWRQRGNRAAGVRYP